MPKLSSQKVFDIIPPEKIGEKIQFKKEINRKRDFRSEPKRLFPKMFLTFILFLIMGGIYSYFAFQKAEIIIWPKTQQVKFEAKITVDSKIDKIDLTANILPGNILSGKQKAVKEFFASGKTVKEIKAEGVIRVYNAYSTSSQVLVATTRFVSADGKLFRSVERVMIPGGTYQGGKLQPGSLDVRVRADQPGKDYNIGPSTFSIPGFAGTVRYTAFYGKSSDPMTGGFRGEAYQIIQQDIDKAENVLKENLLKAVETYLKSRVSEEIIILEKAMSKEFSIPVFSVKAGDEKESFVGEGQLSFISLTFKKSDSENFAKEYIASQTSKDQKLDSNSLKINYSIETIDIEKGKMILNLDISAKVYFEILEKDLTEEVAGKQLSEAEEFLTQDPRISKLEINLWPFWVKRVPQAGEKVRIEQRIDGPTGSPSILQ